METKMKKNLLKVIKIAILFLLFVLIKSEVYAYSIFSPTRNVISLDGTWQAREMKNANPLFPPPKDN